MMSVSLQSIIVLLSVIILRLWGLDDSAKSHALNAGC